MTIIALSGRKQAGKDSASEVLVKRYGFTRVALADLLRELCSRVFGLSYSDFVDNDKKDNAISFLSIISEKFKEDGRNDFSDRFDKLAVKIGLDRDFSKTFAGKELEFLSVSFSSKESRNQTEIRNHNGFVSMIKDQGASISFNQSR